jgi:hypothetical protein
LAKSADTSLIVSGFVIPIALASPFPAGAIVADGLVWGCFPLGLDHRQVFSPQTLGCSPAKSGICNVTRITGRGE